MSPLTKHPPRPFSAIVREQLDAPLRDLRGMQVHWSESSGGWTHLELRPDAPTGFAVALNVGHEYALAIVSGELSREFPTPGPDDPPSVMTEHARPIVAFVLALLGPQSRVRERRAGRRTWQWCLEQRGEDDAWHVVARTWSLAPWAYLGPRAEVVYQNRTRSRASAAHDLDRSTPSTSAQP